MVLLVRFELKTHEEKVTIPIKGAGLIDCRKKLMKKIEDLQSFGTLYMGDVQVNMVSIEEVDS